MTLGALRAGWLDGDAQELDRIAALTALDILRWAPRLPLGIFPMTDGGISMEWDWVIVTTLPGAARADWLTWTPAGEESDGQAAVTDADEAFWRGLFR